MTFQRGAVAKAVTVAMKPSQLMHYGVAEILFAVMQQNCMVHAMQSVCARCLSCWAFLVRCAGHHGILSVVVAVITIMRYSNHLGTREHAEEDTVTGSMLTLLHQNCQHRQPRLDHLGQSLVDDQLIADHHQNSQRQICP